MSLSRPFYVVCRPNALGQCVRDHRERSKAGDTVRIGERGKYFPAKSPFSAKFRLSFDREQRFKIATDTRDNSNANAIPSADAMLRKFHAINPFFQTSVMHLHRADFSFAFH